jgi:hypothetical protein
MSNRLHSSSLGRQATPNGADSVSIGSPICESAKVCMQGEQCRAARRRPSVQGQQVASSMCVGVDGCDMTLLSRQVGVDLACSRVACRSLWLRCSRRGANSTPAALLVRPTIGQRHFLCFLPQ